MRQKLTKLYTDRTSAKKQAFLQALAQTPHGTPGAAVAAELVEVHRSTPYRWAKADKAFAQAWAVVDEARLQARLANLELHMRQRAQERAAHLEELRPIFAQNAANARAAKRR